MSDVCSSDLRTGFALLLSAAFDPQQVARIEQKRAGEAQEEVGPAYGRAAKIAEMKCEKTGDSRVPSPLHAGQIVAFDDFAGDGVDLTESVGRSTQAITWISALDVAVRPFLLIGFIADGMNGETRQLARSGERRVGKEWV